MEGNFFRIAKGLDVAPALADLERRPEFWHQACDTALQIGLLGADCLPILQAEFPSVWRLIDRVREAAARRVGDTGRFSHARIGLMKPGEGLPPHRDGIDCVRQRRYQIALQSDEGVALIVGGETRRPLPGDAWLINVARIHSVANGSARDRITILFDTHSATAA